MANNLTTTTESKLSSAASKLTEYYINDVASLNEAVGVPLTEESRRCASNVIIQLCGELGAAAVQKLPREQLVKVLQFVTINGLDVFSGQVFIDQRKGKNGETNITATPMGNAYEIMTARFGVNVKRVHPARIVHEGDEFTLPQFDGLQMTNVKHKLTMEGLDGKAIAVYYLIEKVDGTMDFAIATREGVAKNLMAQILNASLRQDIDRAALMKRLEGKTLDQLLTDEQLAQYISPAYKSPASRESMIITKMKKNALLHYTRDLGTKNATAYQAVNAGIDADNDMVVSTQAEEKAEAKESPKIEDFDVEEAEAIEQEPNKPENPAKAEPIPEKEEVAEVVEEPEIVPEKREESAPKAKKEHIEERKPEPISIFDDSDL